MLFPSLSSYPNLPGTHSCDRSAAPGLFLGKQLCCPSFSDLGSLHLAGPCGTEDSPWSSETQLPSQASPAPLKLAAVRLHFLDKTLEDRREGTDLLVLGSEAFFSFSEWVLRGTWLRCDTVVYLNPRGWECHSAF